jgi:hypothetical protein
MSANIALMIFFGWELFLVPIGIALAGIVIIASLGSNPAARLVLCVYESLNVQAVTTGSNGLGYVCLQGIDGFLTGRVGTDGDVRPPLIRHNRP